jgi:NAD(P)-dependent dehydrogenase (short-subunit alcohol dehydrogenase family)
MFPRLDFMILNAGTSHAGDDVHDDSAWLSPDGHSRIFAANHLGHFLLTVLLAPSLAPGSSVVVVGSSAMWFVDPNRLMLPRRNLSRKVHGRWRRYGVGSYERSKLANRCFALTVRRKARARQVRVLGMTPGLVTTRLTTWMEGEWDRACVSPELAGLRLFESAFVSQDFDFVAPHWQPAYVYKWDAPMTSPRWRRYHPRQPGTVFRAPALHESDRFPRKYQFEAPAAWINWPQLHQRLDYSLHSTAGPDCPEELQQRFWRWSREQVGLPESVDGGDIFAHTPA